MRSPHVNKKAREQFQLSSYKRIMDIYSSSSKTIDALMKLELPSGWTWRSSLTDNTQNHERIDAAKMGMTSLYDGEAAGRLHRPGRRPNVVTHVKTRDRTATKPCNLPAAERKRKHRLVGRFAKAGTSPKARAHEFKDFGEVRPGRPGGRVHLRGGSYVTVTGSKGKGLGRGEASRFSAA